MKDNKEYLDNLRHSAAHLLAAAVVELWPDTKRAIGPSIENGFYFDFDFGQNKISDADFPKIEKKMHEIVKSWDGFERHELDADKAKQEYPNNPYKHELIDEFSEKGKQKISFYKSGSYWDLCRGGHIDQPKKALQHFKLLSVAGAYWRGSEKNPMLTRIYGTAWPTKSELDEYLRIQEEAKKRDHKKLGAELELFMFSPIVGPGFPMLLPKGAMIRKQLEDFAYEIKTKYGLTFVWTPHIAKSDLYKQSKHWQKYDAMMPPLMIEEDEYTLKPMNCPHHFQLYLNKAWSYRELPMRMAENGTVYRFEKSGEINGLLRVRALTQDDSHWFVPHEMLPEEIHRAISLTKDIYSTFDLKNFYARISSHDPKNFDKYLGQKKVWEAAEQALEQAIKKQEIEYSIGVGEAAFYGPKIDIMVKDSIGREWQVTTIQLDFNQPENFDLLYRDKDGQDKRPAVLHIAVFGSIERFMAILIEHFAGAFPTWLSPVQVAVLPISDNQLKYSEKIVEELKENKIRVELFDRAESIGKKIREAELQKIPYMLIVGEKEQEANSVAVRARGQKDLGVMKLDKLISQVEKEIKTKAL